MESAERSVSGFHYTVLFSLTFAILGYLAAKHYLKEIYPKLVKHLPLIVIILFITSTQLLRGDIRLFCPSPKESMQLIIYRHRAIVITFQIRQVT